MKPYRPTSEIILLVLHKMASYATQDGILSSTTWHLVLSHLLRFIFSATVFRVKEARFSVVRTVCLLLLCLFCRPVRAQTVNGTVMDTETAKPLESVMVSVLRGEQLIDYALTDTKGVYSLPWKHEGTLQIRVSILGYGQETRDVSSPGRQDFRLRMEAIALKEIHIRGGRVQGRKDTVRYDLSQFASSKDVHIKDVLKRLPGVDVEESGQVKYKGKAIDHFLVEGMDVTGGRYNQVNNNLSAKAVKTAEIMENYQSVKALKDKIESDEVALNLKLDPKARDQWIMNGLLGIGRGDADKEVGSAGKSGGLLWKGAFHAMQLGVGKQSLYNYKTNNNGTDLGNEQTQFAGNEDVCIDIASFLTQPGIDAPLDKRRLLFNRTHTVNGNRMYKWNEEQSLRLQAGYTSDRIGQERSNTQAYYQPDDTLRVDETYSYRLQSDAAYAEMHYEDNSPKHYLSNRLKAEGMTERGTLQELQQKIRTSQLKVGNRFRLLRNEEKNTWEVHSVLQYALLPSSLQVADQKDTYRRGSLYADNGASYLRKHNGFTQQYRAGVQGEWGRLSQPAVHQADASYLSLYLTPLFELERGKWSGNFTFPFRGQRYFSRRENYLLYAPSLYLRYRIDYHWKLTFFGSLTRSAGSGTDLYPFLYRTNYRTWRGENTSTPVSLNRNGQVYGEYKNTVREFFVTAAFYYRHTRQNTLYEQVISRDSTVYLRRRLPNRSEYWSFTGTLSKGFYDWRLKTSLNFSLSRSTGKQLTNGLLQTYRYDYLKAEPRIIWSPARSVEVEYHATLGYGGSKIGGNTRLSPLVDFVQRLRLTLSFGNLELRFSGEHYRNDLNSETHLSTLFADASLVYKSKKWRWEASLNNLFDRREYAYTLYSATQSSTSRLNIRPREAMITASRQF